MQNGKKPKSLVIAPRDVDNQRSNGAVNDALNEIGVETFHFDSLLSGALWFKAVTNAVKGSDFLIVDISRPNPNVFYELGYAHAFHKPTILLMNSEAGHPIPSDLAGFQLILHDPFAGTSRAASGLFVADNTRRSLGYDDGEKDDGLDCKAKEVSGGFYDTAAT